MSDIEQQIAERIRIAASDWWVKERGVPSDRQNWKPASGHMLAMAREVVRLMRWARLEGMRDHTEARSHNQQAWDARTSNYRDVSLTEITTLPPPGWEP